MKDAMKYTIPLLREFGGRLKEDMRKYFQPGDNWGEFVSNTWTEYQSELPTWRVLGMIVEIGEFCCELLPLLQESSLQKEWRSSEKILFETSLDADTLIVGWPSSQGGFRKIGKNAEVVDELITELIEFYASNIAYKDAETYQSEQSIDLGALRLHIERLWLSLNLGDAPLFPPGEPPVVELVQTEIRRERHIERAKKSVSKIEILPGMNLPQGVLGYSSMPWKKE